MNKQIKSSSVNEYFAWIEQNIPSDTPLYQAAQTYLKATEAEAKNQDSNAPFLTVITRTQGKRPDMLCDVLLSLTGQTNTNFELLIMGHNLTEEQNATVSELISLIEDYTG